MGVVVSRPATSIDPRNLVGIVVILPATSLLLGFAARAEDARGIPTQSHFSPSILVYGD